MCYNIENIRSDVEMYAVINIDIVDSRQIKNRVDFQKSLEKHIETVNIEFKNSLASPITITLGDEFQIVLKSVDQIYNIIDRFQQLFKKDNICIYAGIGIGSISTALYSDTRKMDGECFIKAREAIMLVKNKNYLTKEINSKKNNIYFNGDTIMLPTKTNNDYIEEVAITTLYNEEVLIKDLINSLIENTEILKSSITEKQQTIIDLYENLGSYSKIMEYDNSLNKSNISQKLSTSNYLVIKNNMRLIEQMFRLYNDFKEFNI